MLFQNYIIVCVSVFTCSHNIQCTFHFSLQQNVGSRHVSDDHWKKNMQYTHTHTHTRTWVVEPISKKAFLKLICNTVLRVGSLKDVTIVLWQIAVNSLLCLFNSKLLLCGPFWEKEKRLLLGQDFLVAVSFLINLSLLAKTQLNYQSYFFLLVFLAEKVIYSPSYISNWNEY